MIKKFNKFFQRKFKSISVKRILIIFFLIGVSTIFSIFCIIIANFVINSNINQLLYYQSDTNEVFNRAFRYFHEAYYDSVKEIENGNYDFAKKLVNDKIHDSIDILDKHIKNFYELKRFKVINNYLLDFKIFLNSYRAIFRRYIEKREELYRKKSEIDDIIKRIDKLLTELKLDISKTLIELEPEDVQQKYYKQALIDTDLFSSNVAKFKFDLETYLHNTLVGIIKPFYVKHEIANLKFKLRSISLNLGESFTTTKTIMLLLESLEKATLSAEKLLKEINENYEDAHFYYVAIGNIGHGFSTEITNRINNLQGKFIKLRKITLGIVSAEIIILIVFFFGFVLIIRNRILHPLSIFLSAIQSALKGRRDVFIKIDTDDEFRLLADHFNDMSRAIKDREIKLLEEKNLLEAKGKEIESLKNYFEEILNASPNAIFTVDGDLRILFINKKANELGAGKEIMGKRLNETECQISKYANEIIDVLKTGKGKTLNKKEIVFPDSSKAVVNIYIYPLHPISGRGAVVEIEDITERIQIEERMLESQKMETVGLLAGGFAHDFNNLLAGIMGYVELAMMTEDHDKIKEYLAQVKDISIHSSRLVQQILMFSRAMPGEREIIDVGALIEHALSIIKAPVRKDAKLIKEIEKGLWTYADSAQLIQAFVNLIINGFEAVSNKKNGYVKISALNLKDVEKEYITLDHAKNYIKITVEDNGVGMPEDIKERIFEPFFTTKKRGNIKGTGLGLSIVYRAIKNHNGEILVRSRENEGTTFDIYLPVEKEDRHSKRKPIKKPVVRRYGRILLVDDEDKVREVGEEILENLGYEVILLKNGRECIEFLKKNKEEKIDLIILDLLMPEMDGPETLKEFSRMGLKIPVLIASGYITLDMSYLKDYDYVKGMIRKPYRVEDIAIKLERILSKKG